MKRQVLHITGWNNGMVNNLDNGAKTEIVNYTMRLGFLLLQFWDRLPEPGDPHGGPLLV
jgi:hypothetical protein